MDSTTPPASSIETLDAEAHFFQVRLELFEGPIDLLLHLVKKNELPVEQLSLALIAEQYFACLDQLKYLDLDIAGEYLVIASTLLSIKSSILLNEPVQLVEDDEGNMIDPHQELLRRIREAAIYKDGAMKLASTDILGIDVFDNQNDFQKIKPLPVQYKDHDALLLARAFKQIISQAEKRGIKIEISIDSVSILDRMMGVVAILEKATGPVSFASVIADPTDRGVILSTFLALLELCKRGALHVQQDSILDEITICLASAVDLSQTAPSEFDEESESESKEIVNT